MAEVLVERETPADDDGSLAELRSIIVGPEQRELLTLQSHVLDPHVHTRDVSSVLPDAIALRATDPRLARALAPMIEEAVTASVRRDPRPLADALFPVMGPAIRKAIAHTLASMMESLSRTIEYSLSWRALRWRWTAFRTGKPFAEIVLLNTLQYRVEQVFVIHRETGLLLQHVSGEAAARQDPDQIAAMLTAIRDFVHDSFRTPDDDSVDTLRVGELSVFVEQGPVAILAGLVRGTAPSTLHATFQEALESIHRQFGPELQAFEGDASPFERARGIVEGCLVAQFQPRQPLGRSRLWWAAGAMVLALVLLWTFFAIRERRAWNAYLDRVRAEPGLVVVRSGRERGKFVVGGLRDPLATDPASLLAGSILSADAVDFRWEPFDSLHPKFVVARARNLLRPPAGVTLAYGDGGLVAAGPAPARWIAESERLAPLMPGVREFVYTGTRPEEQLKGQLEAISLRFPKGQSRLTPGQEESIQSAQALLGELNDVLRIRDGRVNVEIVGHTDADGSDRENGPLSASRAARALELVRTAALDRLEFTTRGVGSSAPLTRGIAEADKQRNRRASFHVVLPPASPKAGAQP